MASLQSALVDVGWSMRRNGLLACPGMTADGPKEIYLDCEVSEPVDEFLAMGAAFTDGSLLAQEGAEVVLEHWEDC